MSDGHVVKILDVPQNPTLHPSRLFTQKLEARVGVNSQDKLVKETFFEAVLPVLRDLELDMNRARLVAGFGITRNYLDNFVAEFERNIAARSGLYLPGIVHVMQLRVDLSILQNDVANVALTLGNASIVGMLASRLFSEYSKRRMLGSLKTRSYAIVSSPPKLWDVAHQNGRRDVGSLVPRPEEQGD